MKFNLVFGLFVLGMSGMASADVVCEAIKSNSGVQVIRGVRISHDSVKFKKTTWFGVDSQARDRAFRACSEVSNSTQCSETMPHPSDRYMNVGDPGFGPRMYVENSTKAGVLTLQWAPADVVKHYPSDYSSLHGKYFAFFSRCEEARAELAQDVVGSYHRDFLRVAREKFLREHPVLETNDWRLAP